MTLADTLRTAVTTSKQSRYAIARGARIDHAVLRRFMNMERDIKLRTAESLANYLDLELAKKRGAAKKSAGKGVVKTATKSTAKSAAKSVAKSASKTKAKRK